MKIWDDSISLSICKNLTYIDDLLFDELSGELIALQKKIYRFQKKLEKQDSYTS